MIDRDVLREIVLKEGIAKGRTEGIAEGEIKAYYNLISKGMLTKDQAASMLNMPVAEFDKKCIDILELA